MSTANGPYADTRDMYTVHIMFRREFGLLPALVRGVGTGDKERVQIIADHIKLLALVLEEHHHSEDMVLWPRLLSRAPGEVAPVIHLMEGHHQSIEKISTEISTALEAWRDSALPENGEALAEALDRLILVLNEHTGVEEKLVLPVVEKHILAAEWEQMIQEGGARLPPEQVPLVFGMLMYEGGLESLPPELRPALQVLAPRVYAAHCERVHGIARPERSSV